MRLLVPGTAKLIALFALGLGLLSIRVLPPSKLASAMAAVWTEPLPAQLVLARPPAGVLLAGSPQEYTGSLDYTLQITTTATATPIPAFSRDVCSQIWGASPSTSAPPYWLSTPSSAQGLATDLPYTFLAGQLIRNGLVSASDCPSGGLMASGAANSCGLDRARQLVTVWQNQIDQSIYNAAIQNSVPAQLLKRLFAQESQFWLGDSTDGIHFGPGHVTEPGLDPLFIYDPGFYSQVCPSVFTADTCSQSYTQLSNDQRAMLRGFVLSDRVNISCPTCPNGFDANKVNQSVDLIARLVIANCEQTGQIVSNLTNLRPGSVSPYEDLWRFTLVNYNVGAGCLTTALRRTIQTSGPMNWDNVSSKLERNCMVAIPYVQNITQ